MQLLVCTAESSIGGPRFHSKEPADRGSGLHLLRGVGAADDLGLVSADLRLQPLNYLTLVVSLIEISNLIGLDIAISTVLIHYDTNR